MIQAEKMFLTPLINLILLCGMSCGTNAQVAFRGIPCVRLQVVEEEVPLPSCQYHSPEFVDLIKQCLDKDPNRRPTAEALMTHPFLQKVLHTNTMLEKRLTVLGNVQQHNATATTRRWLC